MKQIQVIGGGLAGPEAALQAAALGCQVELYEMRPTRSNEAHQTADFAELVCSNSLKSESENTAPWLLKQEMRRAGSILLAEADASAVPAGHALAVDRVEFSRRVAARISAEPRITIHREEVTTLNTDEPDTLTILATGPLTSPALAAELQRLTGSNHLAFYDSISPIVDAATIDMDRVFFAARYDKGTADYINCPFTARSTTASSSPARRRVRRKPRSLGEPPRTTFEGCLPIEELARRGRDTLRFGPMKPVGLAIPEPARLPYAVVQLRQENLRADSYNLVGFQNHLKFGEQARVLRLIPGLENATLPALRPDPPQHLHRRALAPHQTLQLRAHLASLSPASSAASRATPSPSPAACSPDATPQPSPVASSPRPPPAPPPWQPHPLHHPRGK